MMAYGCPFAVVLVCGIHCHIHCDIHCGHVEWSGQRQVVVLE